MSLYTYRAELVRVIDGDTVELRVDVGFRIYRVDSFRLAGINTPELHSPDEAERLRAKAAKAAMHSALDGRSLTVRTEKDAQEKYGRYLAWIDLDDAERTSLGTNCATVNDWMVARGHAVPYFGGKR